MPLIANYDLRPEDSDVGSLFNLEPVSDLDSEQRGDNPDFDEVLDFADDLADSGMPALAIELIEAYERELGNLSSDSWPVAEQAKPLEMDNVYHIHDQGDHESHFDGVA